MSAWDASIAEHAASVRAFTGAVRALPDAAWQRPVTEGKWSPAQIAEHLVMVYQVLRTEVGGGGGMRPRITGLRRVVLRLLVLPLILKRGRIPRRVMAPREVRPAGAALRGRDELLAALDEEAGAFERELSARRATAVLTHPFFGRLTPREALRFCAVHNRHHQDQLGAGGA